VSKKLERTTQEAAGLLNVSRPFVIKEIQEQRLKCRIVNRRRRIEFNELMRYKNAQKAIAENALESPSKLSKELGEEL
jgi:excisionase family DNA binding protein